jgi:hypothetical protein
MADWRQGFPMDELRASWDYKPLQNGEAKKYRIMQIKPLRDYRVLLTLVEGPPPCMWFLEVHRRSSNDDEFRDTAIKRARAIRG